MNDQEYIARAQEGCVVGGGAKQIALLVAELRIANEISYELSQSYCPNMGEFSRGYESPCDRRG